MNIVVVSICYPPEIRSISLMVRELCEYLVEQGDRVTMLTGWPQYNLSREDAARQFSPVTHENGVRVVRIKTLPTHKVAYVLRGVAQILLPPLFMRAFRRNVQDDVDAVIVYSPHLPLTIVGRKIAKKCGARYLLNIQDLFPQGAIDLGVLKNRSAIWFFERMERRAYQSADAITTCTQASRQFLLEKKCVPLGKVTVIPNWIDPTPYDGAQPDRTLLPHDRPDVFRIVFPGVLGPTQGLNFMVDVARLLQWQCPRVCFYFVGDGTERSAVEARVKAEGLCNIVFCPFVSPDVYPRLLKAADAGLLALRWDSKTPTVPGKFFGYLAAALPVIGFLNAESEAHQLVKEAGCGLTGDAQDITEGAALLERFVNDVSRGVPYGASGRAYLQHHYTKEACIQSMRQCL